MHIRLLFGLIILVTNLQNCFADEEEIILRSGQSIDIYGKKISCERSTHSPSPRNPASDCRRLESMHPRDVYDLGYSQGIGSCYIIKNGNYYGVMHSTRGQISPTYSQNYSYSTQSNNMDAATGFYQLVCNGSCL
jgi:hypothetical protein